jgi:hypothetical protein
MAITGRRTSRPCSTQVFSTQSEDGVPRILGTPASNPQRGPSRRPRAPVWRPRAATITFRKSCP